MGQVRVVALDPEAKPSSARLARQLEPVAGTTADAYILVVTRVDSRTVSHIDRELLSHGTTERSRTLIVYREGTLADLQSLVCTGLGDLIVDSDASASAIRSRLERWAQIDSAVTQPMIANNLIGTSECWRHVLHLVAESALFSDAPLLLTGPTGSGKELLARMLHSLDSRTRKRDLIVVDCTTLSRELAGSELFGHERGAFTGAVGERDGAVASANGGTLFLDEVGELPLELQAQLLRVLQEKAYRRVGSAQWRRAEFRVICATNRDLLAEVAAHRFRADLYHRIAGVVCTTPALAQRRADIPRLIVHFVQSSSGGPDPVVSPPLMEYLCARQYEGNVRELHQLVRACMLRHTGVGPMSLACLPEEETCRWRSDSPSHLFSSEWDQGCIDEFVRKAIKADVHLKELGRLVEAAAVRIALAEAESITAAASWLGVTPRALHLRRAAERQGDARGVGD
jgi:transcriptional regulator with GAF, ATPase, and Fis domain